MLQVDFAEMRDSANSLVALHPNPKDCSTFNCYAMIPVVPLKPGTTYTVHVRGRVGDIPFDHTWQFTTS